MGKQAWRYDTFRLNTIVIERFCKKYNLQYQMLNNGYQIRVENLVDFYPVRAKFHNLITQERGEWRGEQALRKIMLEAIPRGTKLVDKMYTSTLEVKSTDGFYVTGTQPQTMNMLSVRAPKRLWLRLIWAKLRGKR